jgi:transposase
VIPSKEQIAGEHNMMGRLDNRQQPLFYDFCLEDHVPDDHLLRQIAKVLDLSDVRRQLAPYYSDMGRPSDPELMIRMLLIGYLYGIRSERRLVEEVHLNLAYRWFCGLGLTGEVPERSSFSKTRHGRFRDSDAFRMVFESVLQACLPVWSVARRSPRTRASLKPMRASCAARKARNSPTIGTIRAMSRGRCANILTSWTRPPVWLCSLAKASNHRSHYR